ncbi:MAG: PrsW family glutamic-type intramembrane protease [Chloroflexi bacterium]|nr:PrsW family glutamic-type intramembrane protease [Chloroflexota bacterium]
MNFLILVALAFAPGIFWLWFFARRDVYSPEPKRLLALTFFLGMVATIPAGIINGLFVDDSILEEETSLASVAISMLFVVGPIEEFVKFLAVRLVAYRTRYFDEPTDGLVYAAAAGLGFASLENLGYVLAFGPAVMLLRAPLSTLAHVVFSSIWGYQLGLRKHSSPTSWAMVAIGVGMAALVHALFNVSVFVFPLFALLIVVGGAIWTIRRFNWTQRVSPFRYRHNYPKVECAQCRQQISVASNYCRFCGTRTPQARESVYCSHCGNQNRSDASYCVRCGDRLLVR